MKKFIVERVYVETPVDTDCDGKYDLIETWIKRPSQSCQTHQVPCLYVANPYMKSCNEDWYVPHSVDADVIAYPTQDISPEEVQWFRKDYKPPYVSAMRITKGFGKAPEFEELPALEEVSELYDYFLDRGYAAVYVGGLGTLGSEGITKTGSYEEILAFASVIDWLNGRARAFTDRENNIEVRADWTTGNVAMTGKSYLGTMCIGVATTGVEGLKTIIPEAAISNWYDYYRYQGLNVPAIGWQGDDLDLLAKYCCSRAKIEDQWQKVSPVFVQEHSALVVGEDRLSGNYNRFWDERNYLRYAESIKASVLLIHGVNDWNVKTNQCYPLYEKLSSLGKQRKMLLHQGEHIYIYRLKDAGVLDILQRWLDFYLKGLDTGIEKEPRVLFQSNIDQSQWMGTEDLPKTKPYIFPISTHDEVRIVDDLDRTAYDRKVGDPQPWRDELVLANEVSFRKKYVWDVGKELGTVRYSGRGEVSFSAAFDQDTCILSAMLVDLGEDARITNQCYEEGDYFSFRTEKTPYRVITRGWINPQNRSTLFCKEKIEKDVYYTYRIPFVPTDYILREHHTLGLVIYGTDPEATQRPYHTTNIRIREDSIRCVCPFTAIDV